MRLPRTSFQRLAHVAHLRESKWKVFAVLSDPTAYLDDSGGDDTGVVLFSGFVATLSKWTRFEQKWEQACREYPKEIPLIEVAPGLTKPYFHMKNFMHDSSFSGTRREQIEMRLAHVAHDSTLFFATVAVDALAYQDFKDIFSGVLLFGRSAYSFAFITILGVINDELHRLGYHEKFALVFDDGPRTSDICDLYAYVKSRPYAVSQRVESLTFKNDQSTPPLQAADLIAWESHKYARTVVAGKPEMTSKVFSWLADPKQNLPELSKIWDRKMFGKASDRFTRIPLEGVRSELLESPEGRKEAAQIFARNMDKLNQPQLGPVHEIGCPKVALIDGTIRYIQDKKR